MKLLSRLAILVSFILVALFCFHSINSINQDIGRHLKSGQIIWQTKNVFKTNLFSFTEPDHPFIDHHWLSEVAMYLFERQAGLVGLVAAMALTMAATFALLYAGLRERVSPLAWVLATIAGLAVIADRTDIRPEIFSYLFLAYFLFAIFRSKYRTDRTTMASGHISGLLPNSGVDHSSPPSPYLQYGSVRASWSPWTWASQLRYFLSNHPNFWLYFLPFVELAWANMHIYFPLGVGLIGLYMLETIFRRDPAWKRLAWLTLATATATLINPNFLTGALEPFTILQHYGYSIVENQSIFFLKNYGILLTQINFFLLAGIIFVLSYIPAIRKYAFKNYIFEIVSGGVFLFLAADMIRNFGPFAILMTPILALNLESLFEKRNWSASSLKFNTTAIVLMILMMWATVTSSAYAWFGTNSTFGPSIPASAQDGVDFVLDNHIAGPVFNNFDVGSYLIWKLYPEQKVFVDGRPEAYSVDFFQNIYEPMQEDPQVFNHYAKDVYHINYIFFDYRDITPWAQSFLGWIQQDPNWPLVYHDNTIAIFLRRTSQNMLLIEKYAK
ncbi:MAG TPA: hypothetical protein VFK07_02770 [Candidatus Paceibacterota bacterium]|nr:hypothetical protein [Candidatus Paceibacterota bacterium]